MKSTKKIALLLTLVTIIMISVASCGTNTLKDDPAVGTWEMTQLEYNGTTTDIDEMIAAGALSNTAKLTIKEDGSFSFKFQEADGKGEVVKEDDEYQITDSSDEIMTFKIKNGTLRMEYEKQGIVMIFEKK